MKVEESMAKKTHEEFLKEVKEKGDNEYEVLGKYQGNAIKILIKHKVCGNEYEVVPYSFLNGRRCPKCRSLKKTSENFRKEFQEVACDEYELLEEYKNARTKIRILHKKCGVEFKRFPNDFIRNPSCPECNMYTKSYNRRKTKEDILLEIKLRFNDEYIWISGEYLNKESKLRLKHNVCSTEFEVRYHDFINKRSRCPLCMNAKLRKLHLKSSEEFQKEFSELAKDEYKLLSPYKKSNEKIKIQHIECGNSWMCTPNNFLRGSRCPYCSKSKGEIKIKEILEFLGIEFYQEYKFEDCKYKACLPFDFYLPKYNMCIEYDGEFHYKETTLGNDLNEQKIRDKIKTHYCINKKVKLLRIPYWEFNNIEKILLNKLNKKTIPSEANRETIGTCND